MNIDLSRFKVVHGEKVLNAICLQEVLFPPSRYPDEDCKGVYFKPQFLSVMAINEDGNVVVVFDEAWMFQFLPICKKDGA